MGGFDPYVFYRVSVINKKKRVWESRNWGLGSTIS